MIVAIDYCSQINMAVPPTTDEHVVRKKDLEVLKQHAFDDWVDLTGYTLLTDVSAANIVTETLKLGANTAATRVTTFQPNGNIDIVFTAGGYTATKNITFNGNIITEVIS